ncbi:MAG: hypothetical protein HOO93_08300 [Methyloglobulus sp.]|nr:hypothetical protein [Methyloglobulus sp.]NOU21777.1 hypothetical protein [Methyloglobulus sp.]
MKINNLLSIPKTDKLGPVIKLDWLPSNLPTLVSVGIIMTAAVVVLQYKQQANVPETKTLAWYMANPKAALADNQVCFDNPSLQKTENCINSLHALEIMHKGPNS